MLNEITNILGNKIQYLEVMYRVLFITIYYGLFRVGEVTSGDHPILATNVHIGINKDKLLFILCSSKTHDPGDKVQQVKIKGLHKLSSKYACSFQTLHEYLQIRPPYSSFTEPFFIFQNKNRVRPCHMRKLLRKVLTNLKLDYTLYGTHSLRIGRSCDLLKAGMSMETICKLSRWKSNAVYRYLK